MVGDILLQRSVTVSKNAHTVTDQLLCHILSLATTANYVESFSTAFVRSPWGVTLSAAVGVLSDIFVATQNL